MSKSEGVIHIGSVSKSVAPALRVGYVNSRHGNFSRACSRSLMNPDNVPSAVLAPADEVIE